jgi:hypothetical protein
MKWVPDETGRFEWRPYYERDELDAECEQIVSAFLIAGHGVVRFPVSTDDLTVMIEQDTADLDLYADLSDEGADVDGLTDFFYRRRPSVRISRELSLGSDGDRRLRMTLAHEYGHVRFHNFLWDTAMRSRVREGIMPPNLARQRRRLMRLQSKLAPGRNVSEQDQAAERFLTLAHPLPLLAGPRCGGTRLFDPPESDWMEWQASYVASALLMPATHVRALARKTARDPDLTASAAGAFDVSPETAQRRLLKLGLLS